MKTWQLGLTSTAAVLAVLVLARHLEARWRAVRVASPSVAVATAGPPQEEASARPSVQPPEAVLPGSNSDSFMTPGAGRGEPATFSPRIAPIQEIRSLANLQGTFLPPISFPDGTVLYALQERRGGRALLLKLDPWGENLWSDEGGIGLSFERLRTPLAFAGTAEGGCIVVGEVDDPRPGGELLVLRVDARGRSLWNAGGSHGLRLGDKDERIREIQPLPDGGCLLLGQSPGADRLPRAWLVRLDPLGRSLWNSGRNTGLIFRTKAESEIKTARLLPDDGVALIGRTGKDQGYVLRSRVNPYAVWNGLAQGWRPLNLPLDASPEQPPPLDLVKGQGLAWSLRLDAGGRSVDDVGEYPGVIHEGVVFEDLQVGFDRRLWIAGTARVGAGSSGFLRCIPLEGKPARKSRLDGTLIFIAPRGGAFKEVRPLKDGGCLLLGEAGLRGQEGRASWIVRLDRRGRSLWNQVDVQKSALSNKPILLPTEGEVAPPAATHSAGLFLLGPGSSPLELLLEQADGGWLLGRRKASPELPAWALRIPEEGLTARTEAWTSDCAEEVRLAPPVLFRGEPLLAGATEHRLWRAR